MTFVKVPIKMVEVWLGDFEFGQFKKGEDLYPMTIVHRLDDIKRLAPDDIEDYAWQMGVEWLVPEEYKGEIVYAKGAQ